MDLQKIWNWVKSNKVFTGFIVFALLVVSYFLLVSWNYHGMQSQYHYDDGFYDSPEMISYEDSWSPVLDSAPFSSFERSVASDLAMDSELDIRSGRVEIESEDAESDFEKVKDFVNLDQGYVESSSKNEGNLELRIHSVVRIPVENFDTFVERLERDFEIESFEIKNYKMDVQYYLDELAVVSQSLEDYDAMREEIRGLDLDVERIELLASITREMRELAREFDRLERGLGDKTKQADMATLNVLIVEDLDVELELWPDDLGNRFVDNVNLAADTVIMTLIGIFTNSVVVFVKVVEYMIYAAVIILPVVFVWKLVAKKKK